MSTQTDEIFDIVVVGGGGSGLAAAIEAARYGRRVLLLEKNPDAELAGTVRREIGRVDTIVAQMLKFSAPAHPAFLPVRQ